MFRVSCPALKFALPQLKYPVSGGIPPTISGEQFDLHYNKHHKAYVDKLNELTEGTPLADKSVEEVMKAAWQDRASKQVLFNQAAQHYNHSFYWQCMCPNGSKMPADLKAKLEKAFGGVDKFKKEFEAKGAANFGSGWTWLVQTPDGKLEIVNTGNAEMPHFTCKPTQGKILLTCDVWEHAYYVDFKNKRAEYLTVRRVEVCVCVCVCVLRVRWRVWCVLSCPLVWGWLFGCARCLLPLMPHTVVHVAHSHQKFWEVVDWEAVAKRC